MRESSASQFETADSPKGCPISRAFFAREVEIFQPSSQGTKSLFANILAVTPCGSIFCRDEKNRGAVAPVRRDSRSQSSFAQPIPCTAPQSSGTPPHVTNSNWRHLGIRFAHLSREWDNTNICINRSSLCFNYWRPGRFCWGMPLHNRLRQQRLLNLLNPLPPRLRRRLPPRRHP